MNPNAALKSLNTNFLAMASRPGASLQPCSFARAALRASPLSFFGDIRDLMIRALDWPECRTHPRPLEAEMVRAAGQAAWGRPGRCAIFGCARAKRHRGWLGVHEPSACP